MSTTVTASYTVVPNESTPNSPAFRLSDSDQTVRWSHAFTIYVYRENPASHNAMERMRDSLSKMLVYYYPLAGRLSWIEGDRLGLNCNAKGVTLIEAESTKSLAEYGDFAPNETIEKELVPTVDYTQPVEEIPLLLVQLTKFKGAKQGLVMGVAISHVIADGLAAIRFINSWAKLCTGDTLEPNEMFPFLDRTVLNSSTRPRFDHPEFKPFPLLLGSTDNVAEQKQKKTAAALNLTAEQVQKLKKKANDGSQSQWSHLHSHSRPYSTYEVVAAHIWRSACKARELDDLQPTVVRVVADIRNRLNPPLPQNYFGNALASALTPTSCARDVVSNPLSYGAGKIREAIGLLSDEYVRSQFDFIRCQERLDWIRASYLDREEPRNVAFYGNPNLSIGSWMSMPVYEADFGWGKPVYFGSGAVNADGKAYIIRSSNGDGSLVVSIHLQMRHMELFNKFFYDDI